MAKVRMNEVLLNLSRRHSFLQAANADGTVYFTAPLYRKFLAFAIGWKVVDWSIVGLYREESAL